MVQKNPISFRLTVAEEEDLELLKKSGVTGTVSGVMHNALGIGIRQLKMERGLAPNMKVNENEIKETEEEVKA